MASNRSGRLQTGTIVLASASAARQTMLVSAGLEILVQPARIDEAAVKTALVGQSAEMIAGQLAERKAMALAPSGAWVIGADQMLECDGVLFDKPRDLAMARSQLLALRDRPHRLVSAACIAQDGRIVWRGVDRAELTMRDFSDEFVDAYLDCAGDAALASVGAYQIEGPGIQLFQSVRGDHFTILGLPLLPLLTALRQLGALE